MDPAIKLEDVHIRFRLSYDRMFGLKDLTTEAGRRLFRRWRPRYFEALRGINLTVNHGEILGVIGPNGCGKSTLLRTIAGIYESDKGSVSVDGSVSALLELGTGFDSKLNGVDNVRLAGLLLGNSLETIEARLPTILEFADLGEFAHQPLKNYSSGMIARISFALVVCMEPDILLIDETLSVGDIRFKEKSGKAMQDLMSKASCQVIVSHDLQAIRDLCTKAIWMLAGEIIAEGSPDEVIREYEAAMASQVSSTPGVARSDIPPQSTFERLTDPIQREKN